MESEPMKEIPGAVDHDNGVKWFSLRIAARERQIKWDRTTSSLEILWRVFPGMEQHEDIKKSIVRIRGISGGRECNSNIKDIQKSQNTTRRNPGCPAFFLINLHLSGT